MLVIVREEGNHVGNFVGDMASQEVIVEFGHGREVVGSEDDVCQLDRRNDLVSDIVEVDHHLVDRTRLWED